MVVVDTSSATVVEAMMAVLVVGLLLTSHTLFTIFLTLILTELLLISTSAQSFVAGCSLPLRLPSLSP